MKRIHVFEFEDLAWFPNWIRRCMTRLIIVMHKLLKTDEELAELLADIIKETQVTSIVDLCSGSGGPLPSAVNILKEKHGIENIKLTLTDLYPNQGGAKKINDEAGSIHYKTEPVDATDVDKSLKGLRTMVSGFHHLKPKQAKKVLQSASDSKQPICIFEISDNSYPKAIWWVAFPFNVITSLFVTLLARPMTIQQLIFTYLIPIIPLAFAWDGAVSNARTYTLADIDLLLKDVDSEGYTWEKGIVEGKSKKIYLIGKAA